MLLNFPAFAGILQLFDNNNNKKKYIYPLLIQPLTQKGK